jgi:hypothetical protein
MTHTVFSVAAFVLGASALHRVLEPLWRQFFHAPTEASRPNVVRADKLSRNRST